MISAMKLDVSLPETLAGGLIAVATMIALFLFATRESNTDDQPALTALTNVFIACWMIAAVVLSVNSTKAHASREWKRSRTSSHAMPAVGVVLPRTWSFIMISLSCLSYTAPQAIRLAFKLESLRGVLSSFTNLCFVSHLLLLTTKARVSARRISLAHLAMMLMGVACAFGADVRCVGLTASMLLRHLVGGGGIIFEYHLWTHSVEPMLASRNPTLHAELPVTIFRWLFQKGGLTLSLYCFFEALGVGLDNDMSALDFTPWFSATSSVITHFALSTALAATLLADARTSVSAVLRGMAPLYVTVGFVVSIVTSLIPVAMFAGREFGDRRQASLYSSAYSTFMLLWVVNGCIMMRGHAAQNARRARRTSQLDAPATAAVRREENEEFDRSQSAQVSPRRISFSAASGGSAAISAGL